MKKIVVILLFVAVAVAGIVLAVTIGGSSPPRLSAQCKHEIAVYDSFVGREIAAGYPNVPVEDGYIVLQFARDELRIIRRVCPPTVKVRVLPQLAGIREGLC